MKYIHLSQYKKLNEKVTGKEIHLWSIFFELHSLKRNNICIIYSASSFEVPLCPQILDKLGKFAWL